MSAANRGPAPDPQAALPGMEPEPPAPRFETTMVAEMPKRWECGCGKSSFAANCWNCNAPKPVAVGPVAVGVDGAPEGGAS